MSKSSLAGLFLLFRSLLGLGGFLLALIGAMAFISSVAPMKEGLIFYLIIQLFPIWAISNLVAAILRKREKGAGYLINLIVAILCFSRLITFNLPSKEDAKDPFRIISYNIGGAIEKGELPHHIGDKIIEMILAKSPDMIALQEYTDGIALDHALNDIYPYASENLNGHYLKSGTKLYSRFPITDVEKIEFDGRHNNILISTVEVNKQKLAIVNFHFQTTGLNQWKPSLSTFRYGSLLDIQAAFDQLFYMIRLNRSVREQQIRVLKQEVQQLSHPTLLCGDLNEMQGSYGYFLLSESLLDGFRECGNLFSTTFRTIFPFLRIDYFFYTPEINGIRYKTLQEDMSDHNPICLDFSIL